MSPHANLNLISMELNVHFQDIELRNFHVRKNMKFQLKTLKIVNEGEKP